MHGREWDMNPVKLARMFDIAQDLYSEKQKDSGMVDAIPFAWARNDETGELIIYSAYSAHSKDLERLLEIPPLRDKT
jgi:hypothetical protein